MSKLNQQYDLMVFFNWNSLFQPNTSDFHILTTAGSITMTTPTHNYTHALKANVEEQKASRELCVCYLHAGQTHTLTGVQVFKCIFTEVHNSQEKSELNLFEVNNMWIRQQGCLKLHFAIFHEKNLKKIRKNIPYAVQILNRDFI